MTSSEVSATVNTASAIELAPDYKIPIFLVLGAIPLALLNIFVAIAVSVFGLFLMFQTVNIRLQFTSTALEVYYAGKQIRSFPYREWSNWEVFWQPIPVLFYFKEVNSIHFLPVIFDSKTLIACLEKYYPKS